MTVMTCLFVHADILRGPAAAAAHTAQPGAQRRSRSRSRMPDSGVGVGVGVGVGMPGAVGLRASWGACRCGVGTDRRSSHPWLIRLPRTSMCAVHPHPTAPRFGSWWRAASATLQHATSRLTGLHTNSRQPDLHEADAGPAGGGWRGECGEWAMGEHGLLARHCRAARANARRASPGRTGPRSGPGPRPGFRHGRLRPGGALPPPAASRGVDTPEAPLP